MKTKTLIDNIGWNFDNTYSLLPEVLMTKQNPIPVKQPELELLNLDLAKKLNLNFDNQEISYQRVLIVFLKLMQVINLDILQYWEMGEQYFLVST
jgi:hypothetical protein